jgi:prepilin-type N-terminal cleavage/methylation domain-containing protein
MEHKYLWPTERVRMFKIKARMKPEIPISRCVAFPRSELTGIWQTVRSSDKGFTLIETLIALAIVGLVAAVIMGGLTMSGKATLITDEQSTGLSLARSQIEYIKDQPYDDATDPPQYLLLPDTDIPEGYSISVIATRLDTHGDGNDDDGIQLLEVTVSHGSKTLPTIEAYKVSRTKID